MGELPIYVYWLKEIREEDRKWEQLHLILVAASHNIF